MLINHGQRSRDKARRLNSWRLGFAWLPEPLLGSDPLVYVWWEPVERKSIQVYAGMDDGWEWCTFSRRPGDQVDVRLNPDDRWIPQVINARLNETFHAYPVATTQKVS